MSFTYDVSTDRGKVRFLLQDNDVSNYAFQDSEIDALIVFAPANLFAAAALGCEAKGRSQLVVARQTRSADGSNVLRRSIDDWLKMAVALRNSALSGGLVSDTWDVSTPNEVLDSFRPEWVGINDLPVVE
jgi:hypothetical protein